MYRVGVQRSFIAQHYLVGGDWGDENYPHSHAYRVEVEVAGEHLDAHAYLVDIVALEQALERQVVRFRDRMLNDFPEFAGVNPSVEHFSRVLCEAINRDIAAENVRRLTVRLWEHDHAWASFEIERT